MTTEFKTLRQLDTELGWTPDADDKYDCHKHWVAHPRNLASDGSEEDLKDRESMYLLCEENYGRSYEYDIWALVYHAATEKYFVFNTSGCSCPRPTETWHVVWSGTDTELEIEMAQQLVKAASNEWPKDCWGYCDSVVKDTVKLFTEAYETWEGPNNG